MKQQSGRLDYLDWIRGFAALIMLQGHAFDSWLAPQYRAGKLFWLSQFLGGLPAPIFLFLVGASLALVLDRMRQKGASTGELSLRVLKRGSWILLLAYAYRIEQYLVWWPASRWSDVFRVDTLNCIAVSTLVVGLLSVSLKTRKQNVLAMALLGAIVIFITPWVHLIRSGLPGLVLDYLNGNNHSYYFSMFSWTAFTFVGIAFGYAVLEARSRDREYQFFTAFIVCGIVAWAIGMTMSFFKIFEYGVFDYSVTSPQFFLVRLGWLSIVIYGVYHWCRRTAASSWSPVRTLGQASLLVYWGHMELVYGRPFHGFQTALDVRGVMRQLLWLIPLMLAAAVVRQIGVRRIAGTVRDYVSARVLVWGRQPELE